MEDEALRAVREVLSPEKAVELGLPLDAFVEEVQQMEDAIKGIFEMRGGISPNETLSPDAPVALRRP